MEDALKPFLSNDCRCQTPARKSRPESGLVSLLTPALKAQQLFHQARKVSMDHMHTLAASLATVRILADAVADGGDLYAPGLREFSRQLSEDLLGKARTLQILVERQHTLPEGPNPRARLMDRSSWTGT